MVVLVEMVTSGETDIGVGKLFLMVYSVSPKNT